jgi:hypothetical protein
LKRILVILILGSLSLHCASRLGVIYYLFNQNSKESFLLSIGLIDEISISICSNDFQPKNRVYLENTQETTTRIPILPSAEEIHLFISHSEVSILDALAKKLQLHITPYLTLATDGFNSDSFQPPENSLMPLNS